LEVDEGKATWILVATINRGHDILAQIDCQYSCTSLEHAMRNTASPGRQVPFPFVIEELASLRPTIKTLFGSTNVYLDDKLLFSLRNSVNYPGTNGIWVYTTSEHIDSLAREFPGLPRRQLWRSGSNGWVVLASRLEDFEEYAFKACELVLKGDQRIGRVTRGRPIQRVPIP
jgi:hypothetical protein